MGMNSPYLAVGIWNFKSSKHALEKILRVMLYNYYMYRYLPAIFSEKSDGIELCDRRNHASDGSIGEVLHSAASSFVRVRA